MSPAPTKPKVAILGGGIAALAAAYELTEQPDWQERFESIVVYQMGFRLGGKGASGRNAEQEQRIEEHGLHVWPGFYENAFHLMRRCYSELGRPASSPLATWDAAFKRHHFIVVAEQVAGQWKHWPFTAPPNGMLPGEGTELPKPWDYLAGALELMTGWFHQMIAMPPGINTGPLQPPHVGLVDVLLDGAQRATKLVGLSSASDYLLDWLFDRLLRSAMAGAATVSDNLLMDVAYELVKTLNAMPREPTRLEWNLLLGLVDQAIAWLPSQLGPIGGWSDTLRRLWIQLDFARTLLRGVVRDGVLDKGFEVIDSEDFVGWMKRHGASSLTLDSALMRGLHNFVFAFEDADPARPNLAAGVAVQLILRMTFTYKGAIMWKMQAGMGDVVFAPLYEVLERRGVQFKFFHQVTELTVANDGQSIAEIRMQRQATVNQQAYQPLIDVSGLPCWPNQPRFEQLAEGTVLQERQVDLESVWTDWSGVGDVNLTAGQDFDYVVLGMPLGVLHHTCTALVQANSDWRNMLQNVGTISTRAAQLWFTPDLAGLGWPLENPILTAYDGPLETWADMTQTLAHESWPSHAKPQSVAYFCCAAADPVSVPPPGVSSFPADQKLIAHAELISALGSLTQPIFPLACQPGTSGLDWSKLHDPAGGTGIARLSSQHWRANVQPSDRYVQSLAGTTQFRLSPDRSGFDNLFLAGDWTRNGLNIGCIEAAVISGRRAARAMLGDNRPILGE